MYSISCTHPIASLFNSVQSNIFALKSTVLELIWPTIVIWKFYSFIAICFSDQQAYPIAGLLACAVLKFSIFTLIFLCMYFCCCFVAGAIYTLNVIPFCPLKDFKDIKGQVTQQKDFFCTFPSPFLASEMVHLDFVCCRAHGLHGLSVQYFGLTFSGYVPVKY